MRSWDAGWPSWPDDDPPADRVDHPGAGSSVSDDTSGLEPLSRTDRCDSCGAQAFVRVSLPEHGELLFCGHHGQSLRPMLEGRGARIRDDRHLIAAH